VRLTHTVVETAEPCVYAMNVMRISCQCNNDLTMI
jgi:hypothetical protein